MAVYKTDLRDIFFNLFELQKIQNFSNGLESSDLQEIIQQFDKFVEKEIYPTRQESDAVGVQMKDGQVIAPACLKRPQAALYENGWYGLGYPEDIGGMPAPQSVALVCTSLSTGANSAFSMYFGLSRAAMNVILKKGSELQKAKIIAPMMSGKWGGTMCLTEAGAGSDVGAARTVATPVGNGLYKIKGTKIFISGGDNDLYENIIHLVLARTPNAPEGTKGLSLFIVSKFRIDDQGNLGQFNDVVCSKIEHKMGIHASATCELNFGMNGECFGELIGQEFEGMPNMFLMMNEARLLCGIQGESQANLAYELSLQYAKERVQFGVELVHHPDVKRMLLRMRSMGRALRALSLYTGSLFDREHDDPSVAAEVALLTPVCKAYMTDQGFNVAVEALQVHGGYGYCTEYGIEQFVRDIKIASVYEGTNGIQAIDFVMRKILKDKGAAFSALGEKIAKSLNNSQAQKFKGEIELMQKLLVKTQGMAKMYAELAAQKKFEQIMDSATDFLSFAGNLVCSWIMLDSACLSAELEVTASEEDKKYYQSKQVDFRAFCRYYLSTNLGLAANILSESFSPAAVEL